MASISLVLLATCLVLIVHQSVVDSVPLKVRSTAADAMRRSLQTLYRRNSDEETPQEMPEPIYGEVGPLTDYISVLMCDSVPGERLDCGGFGIDEESCSNRSCCWEETQQVDVPWCFHSGASLTSQCSSVEDTRLECGSYGIRQPECVYQGCCWRPSSTPNVPWCYHAKAESTVDSGNAVEPVVLDAIDGEIQLPPAPVAPVLPTCGVPAISPNVYLRVVGGVEATKNSWPWMASVQGDGRHFCGGSLINNQWVMSAAHCAAGFRYSSTHEVVLGLHSQSNPDSHSLRVKITGIFPNEKYGRNPEKMSNDVMLLKLEHPVNYTDAISPVCLPSAFKKIPGGRRCYATGWGTLSSGGNMPDKLMQVMLPVIDNEVCNQQGWYEGRIDDTMVCAGFEEGGFDTCQGDSGGPFVCYDEDRWILYGVVSWGFGCAGAQHPGLYGRTSPYLKWMNKKLNENA